MLAQFFNADDNGIFFALQVLEVQVWTKPCHCFELIERFR